MPSKENLAAQSSSNRQEGEVIEGQAKEVLELKMMQKELMIIMKLCSTKDLMVQPLMKIKKV